MVTKKLSYKRSFDYMDTITITSFPMFVGKRVIVNFIIVSRRQYDHIRKLKILANSNNSSDKQLSFYVFVNFE